uniref:Uncharacterized protein n=1 Tax=Lepeophtheirus salmonis TaxID=72036 RepID=A0A0K2V099_LEPSM
MWKKNKKNTLTSMNGELYMFLEERGNGGEKIYFES